MLSRPWRNPAAEGKRSAPSTQEEEMEIIKALLNLCPVPMVIIHEKSLP